MPAQLHCCWYPSNLGVRHPHILLQPQFPLSHLSSPHLWHKSWTAVTSGSIWCFAGHHHGKGVSLLSSYVIWHGGSPAAERSPPLASCHHDPALGAANLHPWHHDVRELRGHPVSSVLQPACVLQLQARPPKVEKIISWQPLLPASIHFMK